MLMDPSRFLPNFSNYQLTAAKPTIDNKKWESTATEAERLIAKEHAETDKLIAILEDQDKSFIAAKQIYAKAAQEALAFLNTINTELEFFLREIKLTKYDDIEIKIKITGLMKAAHIKIQEAIEVLSSPPFEQGEKKQEICLSAHKEQESMLTPDFQHLKKHLENLLSQNQSILEIYNTEGKKARKHLQSINFTQASYIKDDIKQASISIEKARRLLINFPKVNDNNQSTRTV